MHPLARARQDRLALEPVERFEVEPPGDRPTLGVAGGKVDLGPLADLVESEAMGEVGAQRTSPSINCSMVAPASESRTSRSLAAR